MLGQLRIPLVGWNRSGGIRIIVQLANHLAENGWQIEIVIPEYTKDNPAFPLNNRVVLRTVNVGPPGQLALLRYFWWIIISACRDTDICLATYYLTAYPIFISWLVTGCRSQIVYLIQHYEPIAHVQFSAKRGLPQRFLYAVAKTSYDLPFKKVAVSRWIPQRIGQNEITVIPNGIDLTTFGYTSTIGKREFTVGAIARTAAIKGYDTLLELFSLLRAQEHLSLVVLTDDPEANFPVADVKVVVGDNDLAVADFYRGCDLFVFTSLLEGFGLPPLEAMACGVPVVMTDSGGIREYANADNAIIVQPGDVEALRRAVVSLVKNPEQRSSLRQAGLEAARKYSLKRMGERYSSYFSQLLAEKRTLG